MSSAVIDQDLLVQTIQREVTNPMGVLAIYTGEVRWMTWDEFAARPVRQLIEVRAYDDSSEYHAQRSELGKPFVGRFVCDEDYAEDEMLDDVQLLDIDEKQSDGNSYVATGGGKYTLPVAGVRYIRLRNYLEYGKDSGMAAIVDFRIVGLEGGPDGSMA